MRALVQGFTGGKWVEEPSSLAVQGNLSGCLQSFSALCRKYPYHSFRVVNEYGSVVVAREVRVRMALGLAEWQRLQHHDGERLLRELSGCN